MMDILFWMLYSAVAVAALNISTATNTPLDSCEDVIHQSEFNNCDSMSMNCQNVKLGSLSTNTFQDRHRQLKCISFHNSSIKTAEYNAFDGTFDLKYLDLHGNLLEDLDYRLFQKLSSLEYLDLSNNRLTSLSNEELFISQSNLKVLKLDFNRIVHLYIGVIAPLLSVRKLTLNGNPFQCDCSLYQTMTWCDNRGFGDKVKCKNLETIGDLSWNVFKISSSCSNTSLLGSSDTYLVPKYEAYKPLNPSDIILIVIIAVVSIFTAVACVGTIVYYYCKRRNTETKDVDSIEYDNKSDEDYDQEIAFPNSQLQPLPFYEESTCKENPRHLHVLQDSEINLEEPYLCVVPTKTLLESELKNSRQSIYEGVDNTMYLKTNS